MPARRRSSPVSAWHGRLAEAQLHRLTYVAFGAETAGLTRRQGDEVVQLAAVRIVYGKRVEGEVLDPLVNPVRKSPAVNRCPWHHRRDGRRCAGGG